MYKNGHILKYQVVGFSFKSCACLNWQRAHVLNMPIKPVPLYRSGTCMLVTSSGTHTTSLLLRELISLSIIPQMFALMSSCVVLHHSPKSKHWKVETVHHQIRIFQDTKPLVKEFTFDACTTFK